MTMNDNGKFQKYIILIGPICLFFYFQHFQQMFIYFDPSKLNKLQSLSNVSNRKLRTL